MSTIRRVLFGAALGTTSAPGTSANAEGPSGAGPAADAGSGPSTAPGVLIADEVPYDPGRVVSGRRLPRPRPTHGAIARPYHAAPRLVVDAFDESGAVDAALQAPARNLGYWPLRRCYEAGLRRARPLAGRATYRVRLAPSGTIEAAEPTEVTVPDPVLVACAARELRRLTLVAGVQARAAAVRVTWSEGDELVPAGVRVRDGAAIREALRASWPAVARCYASRPAEDVDAGGRLELRFRGRGDGGVDAQIEEGEPRFAAPSVAACVLGVYRSVAVPAAAEGGFAYAIYLERAD